MYMSSNACCLLICLLLERLPLRFDPAEIFDLRPFLTRCGNYIPSNILESQDVSDFIANGWLQSAKLKKEIHSTISSHQLLSYCCHLWCLLNPSRADLIHEHWTANDDNKEYSKVPESVFDVAFTLEMRIWCGESGVGRGARRRETLLGRVHCPGHCTRASAGGSGWESSKKATRPTEETFKRMRYTILACCCL